MNSIEKLKELFRSFPGIGPKQAERFAFFIVKKDSHYIKSLVEAIKDGRENIISCESCYAFMEKNKNSEKQLCKICSNKNRDKTLLMITAQNRDLQNIEGCGIYNGLYFVLGGLLPILEKDAEKKINIKELIHKIKNDSLIKEVILAFGASILAENTEDFVKKEITKLNKIDLKITRLGRGLSTGVDIEYSDPETIKNSIKNKSQINLT